MIKQLIRADGVFFSNGELLRYGTFETQLSDEIARDTTIKNWLISMIQNWQPDLIALEGIQFQQNMGVTTFEVLARLQGILMNCAYECEIPISYVIHKHGGRIVE